MKKDIHIQILQYASELQIFTLRDILDEFPDHEKLIRGEMVLSHLFMALDDNIGENEKFMLSFEDRFRLLEYQELAEARKSSKRAMGIAIISIALTFSALVYSIISENISSKENPIVHCNCLVKDG